eukprot:4340882-Pyramimonas_sp.AAC.1
MEAGVLPDPVSEPPAAVAMPSGPGGNVQSWVDGVSGMIEAVVFADPCDNKRQNKCTSMVEIHAGGPDDGPVIETAIHFIFWDD